MNADFFVSKLPAVDWRSVDRGIPRDFDIEIDGRGGSGFFIGEQQPLIFPVANVATANVAMARCFALKFGY